MLAQGWCCNGTDAKRNGCRPSQPSCAAAVRCRVWSRSWRIISANSITPFVVQGCAPEEAEHRTVESMGDPVQAARWTACTGPARPGDRFFMVAALLLAGALLRFSGACPFRHKAVPVARGRVPKPGRRLGGNCCACGGIFLYGCVPVGTLDKGALYRAGGRFGLWFSGRIYPDERAASLDCLGCILRRHSFQHDFIPIYAAVVYRQRGRGWAGLLVSGFAIVPGLWLCIMVPHLAAACVLGLAGLAVSGMLRRRLVWAWRKEKLCGCAGRDSGLLW